MKLAYVDSSVWITHAEASEAYSRTVENHLDLLHGQNWIFCISDLVKLEVMQKPLRLKQIDLIQIYRVSFAKVLCLSVFASVFSDALVISEKENLRNLDAVHVSFAMHNQCSLFVSTDNHFRNLQNISPYLIELNPPKTKI